MCFWQIWLSKQEPSSLKHQVQYNSFCTTLGRPYVGHVKVSDYNSSFWIFDGCSIFGCTHYSTSLWTVLQILNLLVRLYDVHVCCHAGQWYWGWTWVSPMSWQISQTVYWHKLIFTCNICLLVYLYLSLFFMKGKGFIVWRHYWTVSLKIIICNCIYACISNFVNIYYATNEIVPTAIAHLWRDVHGYLSCVRFIPFTDQQPQWLCPWYSCSCLKLGTLPLHPPLEWVSKQHYKSL